jgi:hypothetical protein
MSEQPTSEYRVEKIRAHAELTLTTGARVRGCVFLWSSRQSHVGRQRIGDLLNEPTEFFPFEREDGQVGLYHRAHVVTAQLPPDCSEARLEPGYEIAPRRRVSMLLTTGDRITGTVSVYCPAGHDRLSDYARRERMFRYIEGDEYTWIINSAHVVELTELGD